MPEQGYDKQSLAYELSTKIVNGISLASGNRGLTTNSTLYVNYCFDIVDMAIFKIAKITAIEFMATSATVAGDGLDVNLYDFTNAVSIATITFLNGESFLIKSQNVLSYFVNIIGKITIGVRIKKAGPIGPSTLRTTGIQFFGKLA